MEFEKNNKKLRHSLFEISEIFYRFSWGNVEHTKFLRNYGTGESYSAIEIHLLIRIAQNPGISVTDLAQRNGRTKGAVSQIITKLELKELIRREKRQENAHFVSLYATPKGLEVSKAFQQHQEQLIGPIVDDLVALIGADNADKFYDFLDHYNNVVYPGIVAQIQDELKGKK
ncbi:MAG: MarR family transcriptional regulator [Lachnospiraceae bacterium]|nr:MarR family transcriptional regulator [Lachnospiraceae bacterium]